MAIGVAIVCPRRQQKDFWSLALVRVEVILTESLCNCRHDVRDVPM